MVSRDFAVVGLRRLSARGYHHLALLTSSKSTIFFHFLWERSLLVCLYEEVHAEVVVDDGQASKQWQKQHAALRDRHRLGELEPWSLRHRMGGVGQQGRVHDAINVTWQLEQRRALEQGRAPCENIILDTSQAMSRNPVMTGRVRSIVRNSSFFSYAMQRLIRPSEHLALLGFPDAMALAESVGSAHSVRDLSGEAMAAPCAGGVLACLLVNLASEEVWQM